MIKTYYSLQDAFCHCRSCPICHCNVNGWRLSDSPEVKEVRITPDDFKLTLGGADEVEIFINLHSNIADIKVSQTKEYQTIYEIGDGSHMIAGYNPNRYPLIDYTCFDGVFATGYKVSCQCDCYEYSLQLYIDLKEHILSKIILNSEMVSIEEGEDVHEIRNVYTMDKTEYTRISKNKTFDTLKIPLVSDSLFNAQDTLTRLKKLIIFI